MSSWHFVNKAPYSIIYIKLNQLTRKIFNTTFVSMLKIDNKFRINSVSGWMIQQFNMDLFAIVQVKPWVNKFAGVFASLAWSWQNQCQTNLDFVQFVNQHYLLQWSWLVALVWLLSCWLSHHVHQTNSSLVGGPPWSRHSRLLEGHLLLQLKID